MATATTPEQKVAERFARDTVKHQLTIRHDDGLYRHLYAADRSHGFHWFEIVTWPGALAVRGDMGAFTFSRNPDMLDFFRRSAWQGAPNLQYWAEKADAVDTHAGIREYSADLLRQCIETDLTAAAEDDLAGRLSTRAENLGTTNDRLPAPVIEECRAASAAYMAGLREELDDDLTGEWPTWSIDDEGDALAAVHQFEYRPDDAPRSEPPFTFDPTEWDVRDWSWQYMWCCHAILWAVAAYDRAKAEQPAPDLAAAEAELPEAELVGAAVSAGQES